MLQDLHTFLATRARQSKNQAFLIRRYIEMPDKFLGKKRYSEYDAIAYDKDAAECEALLKQLKTARIAAKKSPIIYGGLDNSTAADICIFCKKDNTTNDKIVSVLGLDQTWSFFDVLRKLTEASDILLHYHDYDGHSHEEILICVNRGKEIIDKITNFK